MIGSTADRVTLNKSVGPYSAGTEVIIDEIYEDGSADVHVGNHDFDVFMDWLTIRRTRAMLVPAMNSKARRRATKLAMAKFLNPESGDNDAGN